MIFKISSQYKLIVNPKKSGIINVGKHEYLEVLNLDNALKVEEYRYLGVLIDLNGMLNSS